MTFKCPKTSAAIYAISVPFHDMISLLPCQVVLRCVAQKQSIQHHGTILLVCAMHVGRYQLREAVSPHSSARSFFLGRRSSGTRLQLGRMQSGRWTGGIERSGSNYPTNAKICNTAEGEHCWSKIKPYGHRGHHYHKCNFTPTNEWNAISGLAKKRRSVSALATGWMAG